MRLLIFAIKYETSKEARSASVEVVTAVLIKFDCLRISSSFLSKNYNGLFARESCFVVKCLRKFLALKLLFARTLPLTTHWGHSSPFMS
jgi:hypothetical protein